MGLLTKYGTSPLSSFSDAPEAIYGTGSDGSVTFNGSSTVLSLTPSSSVYTLTRDIFCYNMTVSDSVRINPNGYRIFVKNLLSLSDASIIGFTTGSAAKGSILGGDIFGASNSLGGSNGDDPGYEATPPPATAGGSDYYKQPLNAIKGYAFAIDSSEPLFLVGGSGNGSSAGGGVVICAARYIAYSGTGTAAQFRAPAANGTANGGGVVLTISTSASLPANITVDVGGGTNGIYSGGNGNHFHIQAM